MLLQLAAALRKVLVLAIGHRISSILHIFLANLQVMHLQVCEQLFSHAQLATHAIGVAS